MTDLTTQNATQSASVQAALTNLVMKYEFLKTGLENVTERVDGDLDGRVLVLEEGQNGLAGAVSGLGDSFAGLGQMQTMIKSDLDRLGNDVLTRMELVEIQQVR